MKWFPRIVLALIAALPCTGLAQSVLTYHNAPDRSGLYTMPGLTLAVAPKLFLDKKFSATITGNVYAQPLYWQAPGATTGVLIVATESNIVYALNPDTGAVVWQTQLAPTTSSDSRGCGNIDPEGITGTPVIDPTSGTLYVAGMGVLNGVGRQLIYALNASTGAILPRWPLDVQWTMKGRGAAFDSYYWGERSALQLFKGKLYVNYAGRWGDCGPYHGTVIEVTPYTKVKPAITGTWETRSAGGGIWAQAGVPTDGTGLFATTGNTFSPSTWEDGEAVVRLLPGLARSSSTKDYFTPSNWLDLDNEDADLGGTGAIPFTIPTAAGGTASRVLALGKDGNAYLLNGADLGGIGHPLQVLQISNEVLLTEPVIYNTKSNTLVAFTNWSGALSSCSGNNVTMLKVTSSTPTPMTVAWCAPISGHGNPIITTTDGVDSPIVWVVGAEGDNQLHGFNALNGKGVFKSSASVGNVQHFSTLIAANHHLYIAADGTIYAFKIP